ncbi:pentatricopeptide repeat-containing protein At2g13600-like [Mercurialis annua]|uniref:pentatricopeptide repeat-containing protein At2g13600-like n=1 Tax=Mercurialis annua TaxID=3986 RepID=UPI0021609633|nr:pentatricopeptide repeat-containing protein At2g13600-like [Mercurialis annua]
MIGNLLWRQFINPHRRHPLVLIRLFSDQQSQSQYIQLSQQMCESMQVCSSTPTARKLHAQLISTGLCFSIFLQNHLLHMYFNCHSLHDATLVFSAMEFPNVFTYNTMITGLGNAGTIGKAKEVFDQMPHRDSVSWNSMMSAYFRNGKYEDVLEVFVFMFRNFTCFINLLSFSCAMKACGALACFRWASQLHGIAEKFDFGRANLSIRISVLDMYIKSGKISHAEKVFLSIPNPSLFCFNSMLYGYSNSYGIGKALNLFNRMPERDNVSWSTMISVLSQHGLSVPSLSMFIDMCTQGFRPNSMTFACVLGACTSICDIKWGTHIHAWMVRMGTIIDVYVGNGLVDMYAKFGRLDLARRVFNSLIEHNAVSWTSLINGTAHCGNEEEALLLFNQMRQIPIALDEFTLAIILKVCSHPNSVFIGSQLHAITIKTGMASFVTVGNSLITMYSKCDDPQKAISVSEMMKVRNIITWTAMINAFSKAGDVKNAQACFEKTPDCNVITWNSMISMYIQHGFWECSLKLYVQMQRERIIPDDITFATSISACADLAMLKLGTQIIVQAEKLGFGSDVSVANSVVTMYSRCGQIDEAQKVFDLISMKNLVSWNSMIAGYAQNGHGRIAIEIFKSMLRMEYKPDHITYISVLSGCSYAGLVTEGKHYFDSMTKDYGILPTHEHFTCMVDLLGRAGLLEQAKTLIKEMPFMPNVDVLGALLSACKIHWNSKLAEFAAKNLLELDVDKSGGCILLAHIYSDCGKLEDVADIRKLIKDKGIQKNPGYSWIEVDNQVNVFAVNETNHPRIKEIWTMIDVVVDALLLNVQVDEFSAE